MVLVGLRLTKDDFVRYVLEWQHLGRDLWWDFCTASFEKHSVWLFLGDWLLFHLDFEFLT